MIAGNNMKRQKGDMITFLIMTFITAFLLFNSINALVGISRVYNDKYEEVNVPDILMFIPENEDAKRSFEEVLDNRGITDYEFTPFLYINCDYKNSTSDEYMNYMFALENSDNVNKQLHVLDNTEKPEKGEILVPYTMASVVQPGDKLDIKIGNKVYTFKVKGNSENPYFCSNLTASFNYCYLNPEDYGEIASRSSGNRTSSIMCSYLTKIKVEEKDIDLDQLSQELSDDYTEAVKPYAEADPDVEFGIGAKVTLPLVSMANEMLPFVVGGLFITFALLIFVIALIVISFSINNFIQRNMKNTGILEACGYTVSELRNALTVQMLSVAAVGTVAGVALSAVTIPMLGGLFTNLMGITWTQKVSLPLAAVTVLVILFIIFLVMRSLSRKYKKVTVLDALRGGINAHNYKKNRFSFDKTDLPVALTLSLKDTFGSIKKNIVMAFIVAALTISALIGFALGDNFAADSENSLFSQMGFEMGDVGLTAKPGLGDDLRKIDGVKNVYVCQTLQLTAEYKDKSYNYNTYAVEDNKYAINTIVVEGRQPESENEVMLTGAIARQLGVSIGDVITIKNGKVSKDFIVSGTNQRLEQAGKTMLLSFEGLERLEARKPVDDYAITVEDGITYDEMKARIEAYGKEHDLELNCSNTATLVSGTIDGAKAATKGTSVLIAILTGFIVLFVESLLIRSKITREWKNMGISKALGMRSADLIAQISMSNLPVIITGCLIGSLLSSFAGKALVKVIFSYVGLDKIGFSIRPALILAVVLGISLIAILTSAFEGRKVKKLIPMEMITEE